MTWFAIRTRFQWEALVAQEIKALGADFRSYCPMVKRPIWTDRFHREQEQIRPMWTTYVLADWMPHDSAEAWQSVKSVKGVIGIIGGVRPMPIEEYEIEELISRTDATGVVHGLEALFERLRRGYGRGDRIRIEGGPFDGQTGSCNWTDAGGGNFRIMLLGREISAYIENSSARIIRIETENAAAVSRSAARRRRRRLLTERAAR